MYVQKPFISNEQLSPAEKRNLQRRHLLYYLRLWDTEKNMLLGHVADVSVNGLMLVGEMQIPLNNEYQLEMKLPAAEGKAETLKFKAKSCWSSNDVNNLFFDTGFQFSEISDATVERVKDLIEEYGLSS